MRAIPPMRLEMTMVGPFIAEYIIYFLRRICLLTDYSNRMLWIQLIFTPRFIISIDDPSEDYKQKQKTSRSPGKNFRSILRPKVNTTLGNKQEEIDLYDSLG
jgi:hypothetical protein